MTTRPLLFAADAVRALGLVRFFRPRNLLGPVGITSQVLPAMPIYHELTIELLERFKRTGGWHLVLGEGGQAELTSNGRQMHVHITDGGTIWYAVQVSFIPLRLETSRSYRVRFTARADRAQPMTLDIAQVGTWHSYCPRTEFQLAEQWQGFTSTFAMGAAATEHDARFEFNLGHCGPNRIDFKDIEVVETEAPPAGSDG